MKVLLSTGNGRLHLVKSAQALIRQGVDLKIVQGWVPSLRIMGFVNWLGPRIGSPNLAFGMVQRRPPELAGRIYALHSAEILTQLLSRLSKYLSPFLSHARAATIGWRFFGWKTRKYLKGNDIYHVRSGAGQGGAITVARSQGVRVLVDHSIAHPAWMEKKLRSVYERYGCCFDMGLSSPFWQLVLQDCEDSDLLLVNSDFVKDTFVQNGFESQKIRVAYLGVRSDFNGLRAWDIHPPMENNKPLRILFTGGFGFRKGAPYFLETIRGVLSSGFLVEATIVGSYEESISMLSDFEDIKKQIRLIGHVPQDKLKEFLRESDVYLFPSLAEGCAQSGMEAMSAGLCVVATKESGLPICDGETGFIVPAMDAQAMIQRICWLAQNPKEMERVGQRASSQLADYTWERYAKNVVDVYKELVFGDSIAW
jgi:glycosyltransferase involved in cell wall biosynthesis